ncbi:RcnB family protein [Sphingobium sp. JS3065]|uniref:RcnB family protein n=1 Tax=Sphingobium sp. JS3065 TaxID=2970925 RepID=UPI002263B562|nr:RcnB family protein [Sphingobium sp. JS3065]UZW55260.1 RcnB family protein [Sphingobium sp. JS3065]
MLRKMMLAGLMTATVLGGIAPAYAQRGDDNGWRGRGGERSGRPDGGRGGQAQPPAPIAQPTQPQPQNQPGWRGNDARPAQRGPATVTRWNREEQRFQTTQRGDDRNDRRGDNRPGWQGDRRDNDRQDRDRRDNDRRDNDRRWDNDNRRGGWSGNNWNNGRRFDDRTRWEAQRRWDNSWRNDRRYDWRSYRSRYGDRYRMGRYYAPRGWSYGYSRFSIGIFLNSLLYSNSYWIADPYSYRLPPAYGTLRWVRYYDDALLVDIRDGYVVDVIHNFFW